MAQNLDIFDISLTDEEMKPITTLDTGASPFFDHRGPAMVSWLGDRRGAAPADRASAPGADPAGEAVHVERVGNPDRVGCWSGRRC